jgi:hypothetical protein
MGTARIRQPERENAEMRPVNTILRAVSAYLPAAGPGPAGL